MPWKETCVSKERVKFVAAFERQDCSISQLCRQYRISRKTGYKWLARWEALGLGGLEDLSRAPRDHPNRVCPEQVQAILAARDQWHWGPKKLRVILAREHPALPWPAISTIEQILKDHGRVAERRKRRRVPPQSQPLAHCDCPNAVWCCDFKGHFATGDCQRCYPLTISDGYSRYLLRCQNLARSDYESVRPIFECAFREYGVPLRIRSDNGPPFASRAVAGLSRLSVWWIKLGIQPERIKPGQPQENGRHERMHLTLKQETASPAATTPRKQQERFDRFRAAYNDVRPHEALGMQVPAAVYGASPREYRDVQGPMEYPSGWSLRKVQWGGDFYWKHQAIFLSEVLTGETIGLEPLDGRYWRMYFGWVDLGIFDSYHRRMLTAAEGRRHLEPAGGPQDRPSAALQDDPAGG